MIKKGRYTFERYSDYKEFRKYCSDWIIKINPVLNRPEEDLVLRFNEVHDVVLIGTLTQMVDHRYASITGSIIYNYNGSVLKEQLKYAFENLLIFNEVKFLYTCEELSDSLNEIIYSTEVDNGTRKMSESEIYELREYVIDMGY